MRQRLKELQEEIDESTIIVGDINTLLSEMGPKCRVNKDIFELKTLLINWI